MSREALVATAVGVLGLAVLAAFALGLSGTTSTEVVNMGDLPDPPRDGSAGIVVGLQTEPHSVLGFKWGQRAQALTVQVVVPAECSDMLEARGTVAEVSDGCPVFLAGGAYAGGGTDRFGDRIVAVRLNVSRECFDAVSSGDRWPHTSGLCSDDGARTVAR